MREGAQTVPCPPAGWGRFYEGNWSKGGSETPRWPRQPPSPRGNWHNARVLRIVSEVTILPTTGQHQGSTTVKREDAPDYQYSTGTLKMAGQNEDIVFEQMIEPLARAIHAEYLAHVAPGSDSRLPPMAVPWEALPEEFRESNRDQAREIRQKLQELRYRVLPKCVGVDRPITAFTDDQIDRLARMEHDRWVEEKQRNGWVLGPRDNEKKVHPDLIPWDELDEAGKEKDRNAVRTIPELLEGVGLGIYPVP